MSANSYIKPESLAAYIKIELAANSKSKKMSMVVEGDLDKKIFERLYDKERFHVIFCSWYPGCRQFIDLCNALNPIYTERFLVIKDADFDRLNGVSPSFSNLFLTDTHDIEMMMLTDNFNKIISQTYNISNAKEQIDIVMHDIIHLSYIKWLNNVNDTKLKFDTIKVGHIYDGTKCVEIVDWVDYIKMDKDNKNLEHIEEFTELSVQDFEHRSQIDEKDILQLTNGHDLISALERKIHSVTRHNVSIKKVKNLLANSYTKDDFEKTSLCNDIANWLDSIGFNIPRSSSAFPAN